MGFMKKDKKKSTQQKVNNRKKYMLFAVIATSVILVLMIVFYVRSILINRGQIIEHYRELQSRQTELLAVALEGKDEQAMIEALKSGIDTSGENWAYLILNDEMVYMRDDNTTDTMTYLKAKGAMRSYLDNSKGVYSSCLVGDTGYVCGIYTEREYILNNYGVGEFENYVVLGFVATFLALGIMLIQYSVYLNRTLIENEELSRELHNRNKKFREYEKISDGYREQILDYESGQKNAVDNIYDMDIVAALLSKSKDPELYPICFMFISVVMTGRYYSKNELMDIMELVKSNMKKNHVTAEISKGFFTVIMYKTDIAEAEKLKNDVLMQWKSYHGIKRDTQIKLSLYQVAEGDDPEKAFYREKDKVLL
jgi:heme exporter protein D